MWKFIKYTILIFLSIYLIINGTFYFFQEKLLFHPQKLPENYSFNFGENVEEINVLTPDKKLLNGLLFTTEDAKGLIFYLHGNAGSLQTWGRVADFYNTLSYDVFILDYRGYGKSQGKITNELQLYRDNQLFYDELKKNYVEDQITILGYSIGTGMAAQLAATNHPKRLILQAPYYNLPDLITHLMPIVPPFLVRYKFPTNQFIKNVESPIAIFHGDKDDLIYVGSSKKLKKEFKKEDSLIILNGQGHNGMTYNLDYQKKMKEILE